MSVRKLKRKFTVTIKLLENTSKNLEFYALRKEKAAILLNRIIRKGGKNGV